MDCTKLDFGPFLRQLTLDWYRHKGPLPALEHKWKGVQNLVGGSPLKSKIQITPT